MGPPVLLCPGYGCSGLFLDYDERASLARTLARQGFDAWVVDLRGRGASRPAPGRAGARWSWTFDDFVRYDVPAVIRAVRRATGQERVAWVGHSMGGLVAYAFAGVSPAAAEALAAVVTIASPVKFPAPPSAIARGLGSALLRLPLPALLPQRAAIAALWRTVGMTGLIGLGMNPRNVDRGLAGSALLESLHDVALAKLRQLAFWAKEGVFCSADGRFDYRAGLGRLRAPLLAVAGTADHFAPRASVRLAVDEAGSSDKTLLEVGSSHGHSADYGHVDLIFGRRAPEEVFAPVARWLAERLGH